MLTHLAIRDLVIVSALELELGAGMTTLTGETGAGKSILIDALGLTLGEKADAGMIRTGCDRAEVSVGFDLSANPAARAWLSEQALDDGADCLIRRVLTRAGRGRSFINGQAASAGQLRELGDLLVDIHGQHAHQSLLRPTAQRALLDDYGGLREAADATAAAWRHYRDLEQRWQSLTAARDERAARSDLLRFQVDELTTLALAPGELAELDAEQRRLAHQSELQATAAALVDLLYEGGAEGGGEGGAAAALRDQLSHASTELAGVCTIDPRLTETRDLIDGALVQVEEAASNLRGYLDALELDPGRLAEVEARLGRVHDLARKYRVAPEALLEHLAALQAELDALEQADLSLGSLGDERDAARARLLDLAGALSAGRRDAAGRLGATVSGAMQTLGMGGGRFAVEVSTAGPDDIGVGGLDTIAFLVSANPGQPLLPLAKVASGGELSRISLAIQVATAEVGQIPTLVFDEVDVGIGGGVAEIVGRLLRDLGGARQVLCVTHLPQVAAQAHQQLRVRKQTAGGQTFTHIEALDATQRIDELARMLGGTEITATTRAHAAEMLQAAGT